MNTMKRYSLILLVLIGFFVFLPVLKGTTFAQSITPVENTKTEAMMPDKNGATMSATPQRVNYELAYPGMLPDNPLYFIKMLRDRLVKLLINDSYKKTEFDILNSEKRIYAAKLLVDKKKVSLALETVSKGNNYFSEAIGEVENVKKPISVFPLLDRMKIVSEKNKEVIRNIEEKVDSGYKKDFDYQIKRIEMMQKSVNDLRMSSKK